MSHRQIIEMIRVMEQRGYTRPEIEIWLRKDLDIIEEYLRIDLSNI